jgi:tetratricopeptide (TPR) repeat protein
MPRLTVRRATLLVGVVACLIYGRALGNGWALDDHPVIERNPAAHSLAAAWDAAFAPYWPPEGAFSAGLYRPLTIFSYAADWTVSGGRPWWFHLTNVLLHAVVSALVVLVVSRWLPAMGALVTGLIFALHPVHVEAVANVVGRAELLAAAGLLAAVLAARRYRHHQGSKSGIWLVAATGAVLAAQLSKEHAVVAILVLALDHLLDPQPARRSAADLYLATAAVTVAYLHIWNAVSGDLVQAAAAVPLAGRPLGERLSAVLPVQLAALRVLAWPWDLVAEYGPQTIAVRYTFGAIAFLAAVTCTALLAFAIAAARRAPAVAFGILAGVATYAPTSNLFFVSGVLLAERALYLAVLAPAVTLGWMASNIGRERRRAALALVALVLLAVGARTVTRIPFWRDTRTVVIEGFIQHPESFAAHVRLAGVREQTGDLPGAIAQYLAALEVYDGYSFVAVRAGQLALRSGRPSLAAELARFAQERDPNHPLVARLAADVHLEAGRPDSAVEVMRRAVEARPENNPALEGYAEVMAAGGAAAWRKNLAAARLAWRRGHLIAATTMLDSAGVRLSLRPGSAADCWEVMVTVELAESLRPSLGTALKTLALRCRESGSM